MTSAVRSIGLLCCVIMLVGCANPYAQFYHGNPDGRKIEGYQPSTAPLEIYNTGDVGRDVEAMERRGYTPIGSSDFNGVASRSSEHQIRSEAGKVGAVAVLVSSRYTHTLSGAMPLTLPNVTTSVTNGSASVSGSAGFANVNSSATTTTYESRTVMMPYNVQRSDFTVVYFVKRQVHLGVFYGVIDAATRTRLQTNAGVLIKTIVDGAPAARADILPGDIILTIDGERVDGGEMLNSHIKDRHGREIVLGIDRNGSRIEKKVTPSP